MEKLTTAVLDILHQNETKGEEYLNSEKYARDRDNFISELVKIAERDYRNLLAMGGVSFDGLTLVLRAPCAMEWYEKILSEIVEGIGIQEFFDQPVMIFPEVDCRRLFDHFKLFNSPVTFLTDRGEHPGRFESLEYMFRRCSRFNQPIDIPEDAVDLSGMFADCKSFNQPVKIPSGVLLTNFMFASCRSFNQPVTIPQSVERGCSMFAYCDKMNSPVTIEDGCEGRFDSMFAHSPSFNAPVKIPDTVTRVDEMFMFCDVFNQKVNIPKACKSTMKMFGCCLSFNQPLNIPDNVESTEGMLAHCVNFNSPINLPSNLVYADRMFGGCTGFNQELTIPHGVLCYEGIFDRCSKLEHREEYIKELDENRNNLIEKGGINNENTQ